jgi:hypothetical protein
VEDDLQIMQGDKCGIHVGYALLSLFIPTEVTKIKEKSVLVMVYAAQPKWNHRNISDFTRLYNNGLIEHCQGKCEAQEKTMAASPVVLVPFCCKVFYPPKLLANFSKLPKALTTGSPEKVLHTFEHHHLDASLKIGRVYDIGGLETYSCSMAPYAEDLELENVKALAMILFSTPNQLYKVFKEKKEIELPEQIKTNLFPTGATHVLQSLSWLLLIIDKVYNYFKNEIEIWKFHRFLWVQAVAVFKGSRMSDSIKNYSEIKLKYYYEDYCSTSHVYTEAKHLLSYLQARLSGDPIKFGMVDGIGRLTAVCFAAVQREPLNHFDSYKPAKGDIFAKDTVNWEIIGTPSHNICHMIQPKLASEGIIQKLFQFSRFCQEMATMTTKSTFSDSVLPLVNECIHQEQFLDPLFSPKGWVHDMNKYKLAFGDADQDGSKNDTKKVTKRAENLIISQQSILVLYFISKLKKVSSEDLANQPFLKLFNDTTLTGDSQYFGGKSILQFDFEEVYKEWIDGRRTLNFWVISLRSTTKEEKYLVLACPIPNWL